MSKKSRSRSGAEKKAKLRRRAGKLRKRDWDYVDAFARSMSGVAPPSLFGYGNERAHRWTMRHGGSRWWKRPFRTRGGRRKIDFASLFGAFDFAPGLTFAQAIQRRLLSPAPMFDSEYGVPIRDLILAPSDERPIEIHGYRGILRMIDRDNAEIHLVAPVKLETITATIGFEDWARKEIHLQPVDLQIGSLEIKGVMMPVAVEDDAGGLRVGMTYDEAGRPEEPESDE